MEKTAHLGVLAFVRKHQQCVWCVRPIWRVQESKTNRELTRNGQYLIAPPTTVRIIPATSPEGGGRDRKPHAWRMIIFFVGLRKATMFAAGSWYQLEIGRKGTTTLLAKRTHTTCFQCQLDLGWMELTHYVGGECFWTHLPSLIR